MINTIYLDHEFNFLLLENTQEENSESITKIYLNIETDATTGQRLEISVAGGAVVTESIASDRIVKFELSPEYWADNNATEITPKNDDITGATITINFPKTFTTSAALNYISDTEFDIQAQNEDFAGGGGSGSGGSGGAAFDFVETIRNIGFRLLDEPSNVNAYFDEIAEEVQIKWTDPADIATNEPTPATWAGTVVVRKEGSAPRHRWDGTLIVDSTTRDEYSVTPFEDDTVDRGKTYYYGIFPYDTKDDYRFTKIIVVNAQAVTIPDINSLNIRYHTCVMVNYNIPAGHTWSNVGIVYKKGSEPADKTDGTSIDITGGSGIEEIKWLDENSIYYFRIYSTESTTSNEYISDAQSITTEEYDEFTFEQISLNLDFSRYFSTFENGQEDQTTIFNSFNLYEDYIGSNYNIIFGKTLIEPATYAGGLITMQGGIDQGQINETAVPIEKMIVAGLSYEYQVTHVNVGSYYPGVYLCNIKDENNLSKDFVPPALTSSSWTNVAENITPKEYNYLYFAAVLGDSGQIRNLKLRGVKINGT